MLSRRLSESVWMQELQPQRIFPCHACLRMRHLQDKIVKYSDRGGSWILRRLLPSSWHLVDVTTSLQIYCTPSGHQ